MVQHLLKCFLFSSLFVCTATLVELGSGSNQALAAAEESKETAEEGTKKKKRLSQRRYYTLAPFTVPLMSSGEIREQFTIVVAIELTDEDHRIDVAYAIPRIRHEIYNELLHLVTFRRRGDTIPQIAIFKKQLYKVAARVIGDKVKAVLVQQAFKASLK